MFDRVLNMRLKYVGIGILYDLYSLIHSICGKTFDFLSIFLYSIHMQEITGHAKYTTLVKLSW